MNTTLTFSSCEIAPEPEAVYGHQGIPATAQIPKRVDALYAKALDRFGVTVDPRGVVAPITKTDFEEVYKGEGQNEPTTPVGDIAPRADDLALFAVTLGPRISAEIEQRHRANDLAQAYMLDSIASIAADRAAAILQDRWEDSLKRQSDGSPAESPQSRGGLRALRYSPGYCGWHVSGQRKLFDYLRPGRIGLSLRTSFLMDPLKSVSGVLVAGPKEIHDFPDTYNFCSDCDTRGCRERIQELCETRKRCQDEFPRCC